LATTEIKVVETASSPDIDMERGGLIRPAGKLSNKAMDSVRG
jgi:hypothetical protein